MTEAPKHRPCQGGSTFRPCRNPAKYMVVDRDYSGKPLHDGIERPMCGVHKNERERSAQRLVESERRRATERERQERVSYALNVAMLLSQAIAAQSNLVGVAFDVTHDGRELKLDVGSAEKLYRWLAR